MRILACALLLTTVAFADQSCRFTGSYTKSDLMNNLQVREDYLQKVISQEAKFFKEIAFDHKTRLIIYFMLQTGLTLEGQRIDEKTGMPSGQPNRYTSASNEAIHLAMLAKTLNGDNNTEMIYSKEEALEIISKKIHTYESFSLAHPEFEGLLPQMHVHHHVEPAQKKASVSENAQVFWAVYGLVDVLQTKYSNELELIQKWKNLETKMLLQINENGGALYEQMMLLHADLPRDQMDKEKILLLVDLEIYSMKCMIFLFAFGSATASFQVEGASNTNGRGPSIWDDLCAIKGRIQNGDDGTFNDYADFCFKTFGSKVKRWLTFNEPWTFTWLGYGTGGNAPGRCTQFQYYCDSVGGGGNTCQRKKQIILAHGTAVKTYRDKYQKDQGGQIGWTLNTNYGAPFNSSNPDDFKAIDVSVQFAFGWYMDPIVFGKYPDVMVQNVGDRLPKFTDEQVKLIQGSYDFIGLNHYTSSYLKFDTTIEKKDWGSDSQVAGNIINLLFNASGHLIGPKSESGWLYVYPEGLRGLLNWIDQRYSSPNKKQSICIFENGVSVPDENKLIESHERYEDQENFQQNQRGGQVKALMLTTQVLPLSKVSQTNGQQASHLHDQQQLNFSSGEKTGP